MVNVGSIPTPNLCINTKGEAMELQEEDIKKLYGKKIYSICSITKSWDWRAFKFKRTLWLYPEKDELKWANKVAYTIRKHSGLTVKVARP